jgi:hypothetical protein
VRDLKQILSVNYGRNGFIKSTPGPRRSGPRERADGGQVRDSVRPEICQRRRKLFSLPEVGPGADLTNLRNGRKVFGHIFIKKLAKNFCLNITKSIP